MSILQFLLLWIIAALCGAVAQSITGYSMGGCLASTAIGFIGAILGQWFAQTADLPLYYTVTLGGEVFPVVWAIIGSVVFVLVVGLITRGRRR